MREELIVATLMIVASVAGSIITRCDRKWSVAFLLLGALLGSLVGGMGIRFREIVEGPFAFLDGALAVASATLFVFLVYASGAMDSIFSRIQKVKNRGLRAMGTLLFLVFPSALSGFPLATILTSGKIAAPALERGGVEKKKINEIIGISSVIGMMMPPLSIPAIIASNGAGSVHPTPFNGFFPSLLVLSIPLFFHYWGMNISPLSSSIAEGEEKGNGVGIVVAVVTALSLFDGLCSSILYIGGNTFIFFLGSITVLILKKGFGSAKATLEKVSEGLLHSVAPIAFLFALGSFIEVMSMTGVRGYYSLRILPFEVKNVIFVLMGVGVALGIFFSYPLPSLLATLAVFPIGWLASPVIVTGVAAFLSLTSFLSIKGSVFGLVEKELNMEEQSFGKRIGSILPMLIILVSMGIVYVICGDGFLSVLNF